MKGPWVTLAHNGPLLWPWSLFSNEDWLRRAGWRMKRNAGNINSGLQHFDRRLSRGGYNEDAIYILKMCRTCLSVSHPVFPHSTRNDQPLDDPLSFIVPPCSSKQNYTTLKQMRLIDWALPSVHRWLHPCVKPNAYCQIQNRCVLSKRYLVHYPDMTGQ